MKKVLVLGAGVYQLPLIRKIKEMGHMAIVSSIPGNYPGFMVADKAYYINTVDKEAVLNLAHEEGIDAIVTTGTDVAVETIGYVNDRLKLNGIDYETAVNVTNKLSMKKALCQYKINTAPFYCVSNINEAIEACNKIGLPCMIKCVDKSGSRGISKVKKIEEVSQAFEYSVSATNVNYVIVEKFIPGDEIGLDGFISENQFVAVPHKKITYNNGLTGVPVGHVFPFDSDEKLKQRIIEEAYNAVRALNLRNSFFNMDIMISGGEPYIIEVGGRPGATCIPELMSAYLDCDYYEMIINLALGEPICELPKVGVKACAAKLLFSDKTGILKSVNFDKVLDDCVLSYGVDYKNGDRVRKFMVGPDRIGYIIVDGRNASEAEKNVELFSRKVQIEVEEDIESTDNN